MSIFSGSGLFGRAAKALPPLPTTPKIKKEYIAIQTRSLVAQDAQQPSFTKLGNDLIIMILETIQATHAESIANIRLVSSIFNHLAEYISCGKIKLNLSFDAATDTKERLNHMERQGLLAAVRGVEVSTACDCPSCRTNKTQRTETKDHSESLYRLQELIPLMTGLTDVWWPNDSLSQVTLDTIRELPQIRLHTRVGSYSRDGERSVLARLQGNINLHSLTVQHTFHGPEDCLPVTGPLKELLLTCPNIQMLSLDISQPSGGCVVYSPPSEYCGLGFTNGERPPALEKLKLENCPFGFCREQGEESGNDILFGYLGSYWRGYPGKVNEEDYWAEVFDWSRLKSLHVQSADFALKLMPKLTALQEVNVKYSHKLEKMVKFYLEIPTALKAISVPNLPSITLDGILRHGTALRRLQVHQNEGYQIKWREGVVDEQSLARIRDECPLIEELCLDVVRSGDWPYRILDILASFPRLRRLTMWFELGLEAEKTVVEPKVTFAAAQMLFTYLRYRSTIQQTQLKELHLYSGSPPGIGFGYPSPQAFWPEYNSMHFVCRLAVRDDEAAQGKFTCECPALGKQANKYLRGERGTIKQGSGLQHTYEPERIRVAEDGPKSIGEWEPHY